MNIHGTITVVKNREDGNDVEETNILVVDDEKEIADLLEIYLISDGFQVLKAYSAKEGLRILEEKKIDLVLLDVMMPDMDGIAMCRRSRETNNIPIIMVSAKTQDIDKIVGLSTGADDYVAKPFNPLAAEAACKIPAPPLPRTESVEAARAPGSDFLKASGNQQGNPSGCLLRRKHQADTD